MEKKTQFSAHCLEINTLKCKSEPGHNFRNKSVWSLDRSKFYIGQVNALLVDCCSRVRRIPILKVPQDKNLL